MGCYSRAVAEIVYEEMAEITNRKCAMLCRSFRKIYSGTMNS